MFEVVIGRDRADWENEWDIEVSEIAKSGEEGPWLRGISV